MSFSPILYSNGDSVSWGAELDNKEIERYSKVVADHWDWVDCNNSSAGVSNDYIYRQTLRDVSHWLNTKECWSEETGWIKSDKLYVIIGWTSPTRFEWWDGEKYIQDRLWVDYDKWGKPDEFQTTELQDKFILHQNEVIPSYVRTFNHIVSLSSFLENHNIPYFFFNTFYEYEIPKEPVVKIDKFGRDEKQLSFESLTKLISKNFFDLTMYRYLKEKGGDFLPRKHPSKKSHYIWASYLIHKVWNEWKNLV
jgi:hypothetical protein